MKKDLKDFIPLEYTVRDLQRLLVERVTSPHIDVKSPIAIFTRLQKEMRELKQAYDHFLRQRDYLHGDHVQAINAVEDEIADVFILLCFFCGSLGIDFHSAIRNKILKNFSDGKFAVK
jgi:NTP pyrophosphatase (non-canonical NTP hydrolase)